VDAVETAEPALAPEPPEARAAPTEPAEAAVEAEPAPEHAAGELDVPAGYVVLEGAPNGFRRTVAVVVGRFNGDITNGLLASALEVPLAAMALAKTRRFSCVVALGCVIRGETPHFDFVAGEAASGLQLAAIETGIPVSFGVLTCEDEEQARARIGKGAEAARAALEMADLFSQVRTRAAASS
jgi:6,7-dimethyl-8-ribityllumazine synthase